MLETIPNGVATLDADRRIVLANRALSEMMDPGGQRPFIGRVMEEVFPAEVAEVLDRLIKRSHRMGTASSEIEITAPNQTSNHRFGIAMNLLATVALLEMPAATERARREHRATCSSSKTQPSFCARKSNPRGKRSPAAWPTRSKILSPPSALAPSRFTATSTASPQISPIATPATPRNRRLSQSFAAAAKSSPLRSKACALWSTSSASLAEFPTAQPQPADLNTIIENSLALFAGRMQDIHIVRKMSPDLPLVMADPEALKRALGNLIDNAAEAMQQSLFRELRICTSLLENGMVELTIADTGSGLTDEMRERLFLPYFSTKQRGTGLGLAIAAKIIQEHQGTIRAEKNDPAGAKFIVELRPASALDSDSDAPISVNTFVNLRNGNHSETKSSEPLSKDALATATPAREGTEAADALASTIARGQK